MYKNNLDSPILSFIFFGLTLIYIIDLVFLGRLYDAANLKNNEGLYLLNINVNHKFLISIILIYSFTFIFIVLTFNLLVIYLFL